MLPLAKYHSALYYLLVQVALATNGQQYGDETQPLAEADDRSIQLPTDCGRFSTTLRRIKYNHRISSGYEAKLGQFPSYVELALRVTSNTKRCGGVIITSRHILTAGHCIQDTIPELLMAGFGIEDFIGGEGNIGKHGAEKQCLSSSYNPNATATDPKLPLVIYDLAIIKLKEDIVFDDNIQPVCLPEPDESWQMDSQRAYVVGLGLNYSNPETKISTSATTLQVLPVIRSKCNDDMQHESILCMRASDSNHQGMACTGDSGGPIIGLNAKGRQTLYGLVSFGAQICLNIRQELEKEKDTSLTEAQIIKFETNACADVVNLRSEIDKLLEECS